MKRKPTDLVVEEPNDLTIGELRKKLGDKEVTILLGKPEEDYGVVIAQGRGLAALIQMIQRHEKVRVADAGLLLKGQYDQPDAKGSTEKQSETSVMLENTGLQKSTDEDLEKTLNQIRGEMGGTGIAVVTRNRGGEDEQFISIVGTGEAAQLLFAMLDASGLINDVTNDPSNYSAEA